MAATTVRIISRYLLRQHLAPLAFGGLTSVMPSTRRSSS
jgi:hypothetical protein